MSRHRRHSTTSRRTLLIGVAAAVASAAGVTAGASYLTGDDREPLVTGQSDLTAPPTSDTAHVPVSSPAINESSATTPSDGASGIRATTSTLQVPPGMALVTSQRLPLFGVSASQVAGIFSGSLVSWLEAGSPIDLPVEVLALDGVIPEGSSPVETFADYDALVAGLSRRIGGVAVVPLDQLDFRVNVLAIDGVDPLRDIPNEADPLIRIAVVGDIVPGRNVGIKMREYGDYTHPFLKIAAELRSYDITIANLEGNLSSNIAPPEDRHTFSFIADPAMINGMKLAGIKAVSLANNHSRWNAESDWGDQAFLDTIDALEAAGMPFFGAGRDLSAARAPWVWERNGRTVAILGFDGVTANEEYRDGDAVVDQSWLGADQYAGAGDGVPGTNPYILSQVLEDISAAAKQYDIVIPYFHFGIEYVGILPQWAVLGARQAIDAGASAVVTNHPHVIQGMEIYDGKPIVYSVGNFIFDQMFSVETRQGIILELDFRGNKVVGLRCKGVEIEDFNQPRLMTAGEHASLMDRFWWSTDRLAERG